MDGFKKPENSNRRKTKSNKFSDPVSLNRINKENSITTSLESKVSKEQIINEAINYHQKGNIKEANNVEH